MIPWEVKPLRCVVQHQTVFHRMLVQTPLLRQLGQLHPKGLAVSEVAWKMDEPCAVAKSEGEESFPKKEKRKLGKVRR